MSDPSKTMHVSDEEVFYKLLQESDYSSDNEINVKISSDGEQFSSVSALMKKKMSATAVACNLTYRQMQVLSYHVFHLLASLV
jgi:hypothetical protein